MKGDDLHVELASSTSVISRDELKGLLYRFCGMLEGFMESPGRALKSSK